MMLNYNFKEENFRDTHTQYKLLILLYSGIAYNIFYQMVFLHLTMTHSRNLGW